MEPPRPPDELGPKGGPERPINAFETPASREGGGGGPGNKQQEEEMEKVEIRLEDGRTLIYYRFVPNV